LACETEAVVIAAAREVAAPALVVTGIANYRKLCRSIKTSPSDRLWVTLDQLNIMARLEIEDVTKSSGKPSIKVCVSDPHEVSPE
jgi:hypothetical protein